MKIKTYLTMNSIGLSAVVFFLGFNFYSDNLHKAQTKKTMEEYNSSTGATLEGMEYEIDSINVRIRRLDGQEN